MLISRIGDVDGVCDDVNGCANGQYYMALNVPGQVLADPDPVFQLRQMFDAWRVSWRGRPDHNLSTRTWSDGLDTVPGNGTRAKSLDVALIDWEGTALTSGGAQVTVRHAPGSAGLAAIGAVMDHGDGTYSFSFSVQKEGVLTASVILYEREKARFTYFTGNTITGMQYINLKTPLLIQIELTLFAFTANSKYRRRGGRRIQKPHKL